MIITLDSFDLYTSRPRQALLYVLLDAVQAGSYTPGLCVVGMTSRLDTTDLLEKRVRSRFGGRTINVWPEDVWLDVLKRTLQAGLSGDSSREGKEFDRAWQGEIESVCTDKKVLAMLEDWRGISNVVRTLHKTLVSGVVPAWEGKERKIGAHLPRVCVNSTLLWLPCHPLQPHYILPFWNISDCSHPCHHSRCSLI